MDQHELDILARRLARPTTRRTGIAVLLSGLFGLGGPTGETDATKKANRRRKRNKRGSGRQVCNTSADCPVKGQECLLNACVCIWDTQPHDACGGVCCTDGQRCFNGKCTSTCRLPLKSGGDYTGCDFSGQEIAGDLSRVRIVGSNLQGALVTASLRNVSFDGSDLGKAIFRPTLMDAVMFRQANIVDTIFEPAAITGDVIFDRARLRGITWTEPVPTELPDGKRVRISFDGCAEAFPDYVPRELTKHWSRFLFRNDGQGRFEHSFRDVRISVGVFTGSNLRETPFVGSYFYNASFAKSTNYQDFIQQYGKYTVKNCMILPNNAPIQRCNGQNMDWSL